MGIWHKTQQSYFKNTEITISNFRADAVKDNFAFEFQDKHLMYEFEIIEKNIEYVKNNFIPIWVLNINDHAIILDKQLIIDKDYIKPYLNCDHLYYSFNNNIIKSTDLNHYIPEKEFYENFSLELEFNNTPVLPENFTQNFEYIQMGAGSGKTYSLVKDVLTNDNKINILITKVNVAKDTIFDKFKEVCENENLKYPENITPENKKYYILNNENKIIIIATVDSFLYNFLSTELKEEMKKSCNSFKTAAQQFTPTNSKINFSYRGECIKNAHVYIDEAQDLDAEYKNFIEESAKIYNFQITLIGDILQSIYHVPNLYSLVTKDEKWKLKNNADYICRRFQNTDLMNYVNEKIHKYITDSVTQIHQPIKGISASISESSDSTEENKLNSSEQVSETSDSTNLTNNVQEKIINVSGDSFAQLEDDNSLSDVITEILNENSNCEPSDYAFIFPYMKKYNVANHIQNILSNKFGENFVHLFTSEKGEPIVLKPYAHCAKLLTVHASKGEGFNIVVVVNVQTSTLNVYKQNEDLFYWSMLNVAYTRAKQKLYVVNFNNNLKNPINIPRFTTAKDFVRSVNPTELLKFVNTEEYSTKIEDNKNQSVIDENIRCLRYLVVRNSIVDKAMCAKNINEYIAQTLNLKNSRPINNEQQFKTLANEYNKIVKIGKRNKILPIWNYSRAYPEAWKIVVKVMNILKESYFNPKLASDKMKNSLYEKSIYYTLLELTKNPWFYTEFKTLLELIENNPKSEKEKDKPIWKDYFKYFNEANKFIEGNFPNIDIVGTQQKYHCCELLSNRFMLIPKKQSKGNKSLSENCDYVVSEPLNTSLSILNFSEVCLTALIEYYILKCKKEDKVIRVFTIAADEDKKLIDFDFSYLTDYNIAEIENIVKQHLHEMVNQTKKKLLYTLFDNKNKTKEVLLNTIEKYVNKFGLWNRCDFIAELRALQMCFKNKDSVTYEDIETEFLNISDEYLLIRKDQEK